MTCLFPQFPKLSPKAEVFVASFANFLARTVLHPLQPCSTCDEALAFNRQSSRMPGILTPSNSMRAMAFLIETERFAHPSHAASHRPFSFAHLNINKSRANRFSFRSVDSS